MFTSIFFSSFVLASTAFISLSYATDVLLDLENVTATVYYDITNQYCGDTFGNDWATTSGINGGIPKCEAWAGASAKSLNALGNNRIVALNATMVGADPDQWCGKEVKVFDASGSEVTFAEGSFVLWDGCAACATAVKVDFSAEAFVQLNGGTCGGTNPSGLHVQVMNNNIWQPITSGGSGGTESTSAEAGSSSSASTPASATPNAVIPTSTSITSTPRTTTRKTSAKFSSVVNDQIAASSSSSSTAEVIGNELAQEVVASTTSSAFPTNPIATITIAQNTVDLTSSAANHPASSASNAPASSSGSANTMACTYGNWQCDGLALQVCNYITTTSVAWESITTCATECSVLSTGASLVCQ